MTKRTAVLVGFAGLGIVAAIVATTRHRVGVSQFSDLVDQVPGTPREVGHAREPAQALRTPPTSVPSPAPVASSNKEDAADIVGSTDPTAKGYDPMTVVRTMNITPAEVFDKEPRDPMFAGPRERALRARLIERLHRRLGIDAKIDADCRTSSCEVTLQDLGADVEPDAALQALDIDWLGEAAQLGPLRNPSDPRRKGTSIVMLFSNAMRDPAAYDQQLRKHEANDEPAHKTP